MCSTINTVSYNLCDFCLLLEKNLILREILTSSYDELMKYLHCLKAENCHLHRKLQTIFTVYSVYINDLLKQAIYVHISSIYRIISLFDIMAVQDYLGLL